MAEAAPPDAGRNDWPLTDKALSELLPEDKRIGDEQADLVAAAAEAWRRRRVNTPGNRGFRTSARRWAAASLTGVSQVRTGRSEQGGGRENSLDSLDGSLAASLPAATPPFQSKLL